MSTDRVETLAKLENQLAELDAPTDAHTETDVLECNKCQCVIRVTGSVYSCEVCEINLCKSCVEPVPRVFFDHDAGQNVECSHDLEFIGAESEDKEVEDGFVASS